MIKKLQKELQTLDNSRTMLLGKIKELRSNKTIKCICGKYHKIKDMDMIIPQGWGSSSGYSDGYSYDKGLHTVCTKVPNVANRLWFESNYKVDYYKRNNIDHNAEEQFKRLYLGLFKTLQRIDEDKVPYNWINNTYIDENHKKFEIEVKGLI